MRRALQRTALVGVLTIAGLFGLGTASARAQGYGVYPGGGYGGYPGGYGGYAPGGYGGGYGGYSAAPGGYGGYYGRGYPGSGYAYYPRHHRHHRGCGHRY